MSMWIQQYIIGTGHTAQRECSNELVAELLAGGCFKIEHFSPVPYHGVRFYDDLQHEAKFAKTWGV